MLLATTAIILPDVSFTVPCNTSSGITRHRVPLVQFGAGRLIPSLETIGLTNGSRRPCAPNALTDGFGFSAVWAAGASGDFLAVPVAGAFAGTVTLGFAAGLAWFATVFLAGGAGLTAITAGAFAGAAFFASIFLGVALTLSLAVTTSVGTPFACVPAGESGFTGAVLVFTLGFLDAPDTVPLVGSGSALGVAVLLLAVFAAVPAAVLALDFCPLTAFLAAGLVVLPVLLEATGVGVGGGWLLAPEFCAVATVAMAVASARIFISFISIPFCALFILKLFTASRLARELVDPASAAPEPAVLPVHG